MQHGVCYSLKVARYSMLCSIQWIYYSSCNNIVQLAICRCFGVKDRRVRKEREQMRAKVGYCNLLNKCPESSLFFNRSKNPEGHKELCMIVKYKMWKKFLSHVFYFTSKHNRNIFLIKNGKSRRSNRKLSQLSDLINLQ